MLKQKEMVMCFCSVWAQGESPYNIFSWLLWRQPAASSANKFGLTSLWDGTTAAINRPLSIGIVQQRKSKAGGQQQRLPYRKSHSAHKKGMVFKLQSVFTNTREQDMHISFPYALPQADVPGRVIYLHIEIRAQQEAG